MYEVVFDLGIVYPSMENGILVIEAHLLCLHLLFIDFVPRSLMIHSTSCFVLNTTICLASLRKNKPLSCFLIVQVNILDPKEKGTLEFDCLSSKP